MASIDESLVSVQGRRLEFSWNLDNRALDDIRGEIGFWAYDAGAHSDFIEI